MSTVLAFLRRSRPAVLAALGPPIVGGLLAAFVVFWVALGWRILGWIIADLPPPTVAPMLYLAGGVVGISCVVGWWPSERRRAP